MSDLATTLRLVISGESRGAQKALADVGTAAQGSIKKAGRDFGALGERMQGIGTAMTAGVTLPIVGGMALAVKAASDLDETMNKVNVVFGEAAGGVRDFMADASKSLGMSKQQAGEAVATFGNLLAATGKTKEETAKMSEGMVQLASDMSSFNNIPMAEALEKIRAGLVGETEPLRTVGVMLDDATLRQKAMDMGLVKSTKEVLPPGIKMQAAYAAILDQTKVQQGDFARTSDGLANSTRIASAQVKDMAASLGQDLIPMAKDALGVIKPLIDAVANMPSWMRKLVIGVGLGVAVAGPVIAAGGSVLRGITSAQNYMANRGGGGTATATVGVDKLGTSSSVAATEVSTLGRAAAGASGKAGAAGTQLGTMGGTAKTAGGKVGTLGSKAQTTVQPLTNLTGATKTASPSVRTLGGVANTAGGKFTRLTGALGNSTVGSIGASIAFSAALAFTIPKVLEAGNAFVQWMSALKTLDQNRDSKLGSVATYKATVTKKYGSIEAYLDHLAQKYGKDSFQYNAAIEALGLGKSGNRSGRLAGAIPMATGGNGYVDRPTLFLAGEKNRREYFSFTPAGQANAAGGKVVELHIHVHAEGANFIGTDREAARKLGEMVMPTVEQKLAAVGGSGF